ncbi:MAG TPA: acetylornithine/succinylornithine family transaminase [Longimicrobiales bacterium]|nr:acetylornithine/succinylornithine family transaminase [Longimicrobiales bacterium]
MRGEVGTAPGGRDAGVAGGPDRDGADGSPVDGGSEPGDRLLPVYRRPDLLFVRGEGSRLHTADGRTYLDFTSGIGVNALGHGSPVVRDAIEAALETGLVHTSNLYRTAPGEALAELLVSLSFPGAVFFCNSGAEAGEAAFKFARRAARERGGPAKHEIVAFRGSFHGRLFGTLAATDRPGYREPFEPLMPGVRFVDVGDSAALEEAVSPSRTAAVVVEPIQGEGGVRPVPAAFLRELRTLCTEREASLIFDEVQCGLGRTGRLFAYQGAGVEPDLLCLAKPLAGGLPMGAVVVAEEVGSAVVPGDHATTFGGGPLVASVALAVVSRLADPAFLEGVATRGRWLEERLGGLRERRSVVREVRGAGLMWGLELRAPAAEVVDAARQRGLLVVPAGASVVRLLPPLNVSLADLETGIDRLEEALP